MLCAVWHCRVHVYSVINYIIISILFLPLSHCRYSSTVAAKSYDVNTALNVFAVFCVNRLYILRQLTISRKQHLHSGKNQDAIQRATWKFRLGRAYNVHIFFSFSNVIHYGTTANCDVTDLWKRLISQSNSLIYNWKYIDRFSTSAIFCYFHVACSEILITTY